MKTIINILIGVLVGLLAAGAMYLTVRTPTGEPIQLMPSPTAQPIVVYITGGVNLPGIYRLPAESRLVDLVEQAGGFQEGVDFSRINLADPIEDGQQVVIPGGSVIATPVLTIGGGGLLFTPTPPAGRLVDINIATLDELEKLPGIGPTAAQKIIDYRTTNGPFARIDDLLKVPGIGPSILEEIRGLIIVGP